jgi:two-component system chemotaxis response regulator CheB
VSSIPSILRDTPGVQVLVVIGASTGGPRALAHVFERLPVLECASICIVQHMPPGFTGNLARRLAQISQWDVREATDGEAILPRRAYVAPGGYQTEVRNLAGHLQLSVSPTGPVNGHQPSVDVLFHSAVKNFPGPLIGVLLTGMGKDGAAGLRAIRERAGHTIAEAECTCVVFGMPRAAIAMNAARQILPIDRIHTAIVESYQELMRERRMSAGGQLLPPV